MAKELNRGEIWLYTFRPPDKRRPVLILSRQEVIDLLSTVIVAPTTSTMLGLPSEVGLGVEDGLKRPCAANLDHIQTVEKSRLRQFLGAASEDKMSAFCRALGVATGCS